MPSDVDRRVSRRRVATVAKREFRATVSRPGYLVTLVAMPLLLATIGLLPAVGLALSGGVGPLLGLPEGDQLQVIAVVDASGAGVVDPALVRWHNDDQQAAAREERRRGSGEAPAIQLPPILQGRLPDPSLDRGGYDDDSRIELRLVGIDEARRLVAEGEAGAGWVAGADYLQTATLTVLLPENNPLNPGLYPGRLAVARLLRQSLAAPYVKDQQVIDRLLNVMNPVEEVVGVAQGGLAATDAAAEILDEGMAMLLPLLFASFFAMSIFVGSGYLLDGIGEEKENRVLEILLATLRPEELLLGKVIGLGAAGLLQTAALGVLGLLPLLAMGLATLGPGTLLPMVACVVLGYAEYASLMAAAGAVAGNRHEGRQISAVFTLTAASPMFLLPVFLAAPDGAVSTVMSLVPLTAPIAMTMRLGVSSVPGWELTLGLVGMTAMAWLSWRLGSRVFRVAILMTGARPGLRQIWQWMRTG